MMEHKEYAAGPIDLDPEEKSFSGTVGEASRCNSF
jgi:hypothetical protein